MASRVGPCEAATVALCVAACGPLSLPAPCLRPAQDTAALGAFILPVAGHVNPVMEGWKSWLWAWTRSVYCLKLKGALSPQVFRARENCSPGGGYGAPCPVSGEAPAGPHPVWTEGVCTLPLSLPEIKFQSL